MKKVRCDFCGYNKHKGSLQEHHIDGNHFNNKRKNKQILCANCHIELHHKERKAKRRRHLKFICLKQNRYVRIKGWLHIRPLDQNKKYQYMEYKNKKTNKRIFIKTKIKLSSEEKQKYILRLFLKGIPVKTLSHLYNIKESRIYKIVKTINPKAFTKKK